MTDTVHQRIDHLSQVVEKMNDNHVHERRETSRLMEKLVDGQTQLGAKFAERTAYDKATQNTLSELKERVAEQGKAITNLQIETSANSEARRNATRLRQTMTGVVMSILITGALFAWTIMKAGT